MPPFLDDLTQIPDASVLYRLVVVQAGADRDPTRLSNGDFQYQREDKARELGYEGPCLSVGVAHAMQAAGETLDVMFRHREPREGELIGFARLRAGQVRQLIGADESPLPHGLMFGPGDYVGHAVIFPLSQPRKTPTQKALCRAAEWAVVPQPAGAYVTTPVFP